MPDFAIQVHDIDEAGKDYAFPVTAGWIEAQLGETGLRPDRTAPEGSVAVHAQKNGVEYLVHGQLKASLLTDCVRCLGDAKVPVDVLLAALYTRGAAPEAPAEIEVDDEDDDDLQHEHFSGHEIALDDLVREYLVLECPMQPLCSPTCTGIPVPQHVKPPEEVFGPSEGGVDPRLAPLLRLRDKVPPKKKS
jgi:uncharacterized protein